MHGACEIGIQCAVMITRCNPKTRIVFLNIFFVNFFHIFKTVQHGSRHSFSQANSKSVTIRASLIMRKIYLIYVIAQILH